MIINPKVTNLDKFIIGFLADGCQYDDEEELIGDLLREIKHSAELSADVKTDWLKYIQTGKWRSRLPFIKTKIEAAFEQHKTLISLTT